MGKQYEAIDGRLRTFLGAQQMFFVATAPRADDGHVNLSPKALDGFRILGPRRVAYVDYPGSGVETIAHLRENGRIVVMFCAFTGPPNIVRLWGRGRAVEPHEDEFPALLDHFEPQLAVRSIIVVDITRIADSCGFAVPRYDFVEQRPQLIRWAEKRGPDGLETYQREKNAASIDGLPGLSSAQPFRP